MASITKPGYINVTFDAGGQGSSVDTNPQAFGISEEPDTFFAEWRITARHNTFEECVVEFGNIVPCHLDALPEGYRFEQHQEQGESGQVTRWRWDFTREKGAPALAELAGLIDYEIFFTYRMRSDPRHRQTVSLRQAFSVDPSLILPPRDGVGGAAPTPKDLPKRRERRKG